MKTTITTMLAVIAVLLGLNLLVLGSPPAEAQTTEEGPVTRRVVGGAVAIVNSDTERVYRFWSDGSVDLTTVHLMVDPENTIGHVLEDDLPPCGTTDVIPPSCPADINRDRDVGVGDMLDVFAQWGPCE